MNHLKLFLIGLCVLAGIFLLMSCANQPAWLLTYEFEVASCGRPGEIEMAKIQALVPKALKSLVNYLE